MLFDDFVLTCEHGGNQVPAAYQHLFGSRKAERALRSHRGYDLGALAVAKQLKAQLGTPLYASTVTRLLVDLNRSQGHPKLFSEFSSVLDEPAQAALVERYYRPHRRLVEDAIAQHASTELQTLHLAIHSFTPILAGQVRNTDLAFLYDPKRKDERALCVEWKQEIKRRWPQLRVRLNYPYRGNSDGLTTALRRRFPAQCYLGIEIELNQKLATNSTPGALALAQLLAGSLHSAAIRFAR